MKFVGVGQMPTGNETLNFRTKEDATETVAAARRAFPYADIRVVTAPYRKHETEFAVMVTNYAGRTYPETYFVAK